MRDLDVPRRMVSLVEGEGLFNDATALVAYRVAVGAVVAGSFSLGHATVLLIVDAAGGIAIGLAVGWIIAEVRKRTPDPTISLVSGYAAFVPANALGLSGVLAAVTTGVYMGIRGPSIIPARVRLQGYFTWDILDFIINAALFVLVGLQLRGIIQDLSGYTTGQLIGWALAICGITVLIRIVWFLTVPYLLRAVDRRRSQRSLRAPARNRLAVGWSGMRGAVSLAAALALPLTVKSGAAFPD
jgi:CPA1 family monovalent cation:H+ antiporter